MSSATTDPYEVHRRAVEEDILDAIRASPYADTSVREVAEAFDDLDYQTVRKHVRRLRENGEVEVTRRVGPAKLYRVAE